MPESERITTFDWVMLTCYPAELKKQLRHWQEITAPQSTQQQVQLDQRNHGSPRVKRPAEEDLHRQYEPMS